MSGFQMLYDAIQYDGEEIRVASFGNRRPVV